MANTNQKRKLVRISLRAAVNWRKICRYFTQEYSDQYMIELNHSNLGSKPGIKRLSPGSSPNNTCPNNACPNNTCPKNKTPHHIPALTVQWYGVSDLSIAALSGEKISPAINSLACNL